jgi:hypothetical protein
MPRCASVVYESLGVINLENAHNGLRFRIRVARLVVKLQPKYLFIDNPGLLHPFVWSAQARARGAGVVRLSVVVHVLRKLLLGIRFPRPPEFGPDLPAILIQMGDAKTPNWMMPKHG